MTKNLRYALNVIEGLLANKEFGPELWDILVALRGPDVRDPKVKYATTAVIRQAAFPNRPTDNGSVYKRDTEEYARRRRDLFDEQAGTNHFREHVADAFEALGMDIYNVNR